MRRIKNILQNYTTFRVFTILCAVLLAVALIVIVRLVRVWFEDAAAERGYSDLRHHAPDDVYAEYYPGPGPVELVHDLSPNSREESEEDDDEEDPEPPPGMTLEPSPELASINNHYAGWMRIENTNVDYPMVQYDNVKYLDTTFWGTHNRAGTLFLDERNPYQFNGTFVIVYGHNSRSGGMFGSLHRYTNTDHMARHPDITVFTRFGEVLTYRIIAAFQTDVHDILFTLFNADEEQIYSYFSEHGTPSGSTNFLALSTCVTSNSDDDRFLVLAAR